MQLIYYDESGNLGSTFSGDKASRSCRYLTIAFLQIPSGSQHLFKRIVKDIYKHEYNVLKANRSMGSFDDFKKDELKGNTLSDSSRLLLVSKIENAIVRMPAAKLYAITVDKSRCTIANWENNRNLLYNYMVGLAVPKSIDMNDDCELHPDPRSIKAQATNSFLDYMKIKLWYECDYKHLLTSTSINSENCLALQFIDFVCNIVWRSYERNETKVFNLLKPHLTDLTELYFRKHNM